VDCDAKCALCVTNDVCLKCNANKIFDTATQQCVDACTEYMDLDPLYKLCLKMNTFQYTVNANVKITNPVSLELNNLNANLYTI
jgi:hypothetical protein